MGTGRIAIALRCNYPDLKANSEPRRQRPPAGTLSWPGPASQSRPPPQGLGAAALSVKLASGPVVVPDQGEGQVYHAAVAPFLQWESTLLEDREHRAVLTEHVRLKSGKVLAAGEDRQMRKQPGCDSAPLKILFDDKCKFCRTFGSRLVGPDVAPRSNDRLAPYGFCRHDQRHFALEIDVDRTIELGVRGIVSVAEEPCVDRVLFQQPERFQKALTVCGPDRPDRHARSVLEDVAHRVIARMVHGLSCSGRAARP